MRAALKRGIQGTVTSLASRLPPRVRRLVARSLLAAMRLALRSGRAGAPLRSMLVATARVHRPVNDLLVGACTDDRGFIRFPCGQLANYRMPWHRDYTLGFLFAGGVVEPAAARAAAAILRPGDGVIDVGANVGYSALHYAQLVGESGRVLALEPDPVLAHHLEAVGAINAMPQFLVRRVAASARPGVETFLPGEQSYLGRLALSGEGKLPGAITVRTISLDALAEEEDLRRVALVKIDVEGAELGVLEGMQQMLRRSSPEVLIEFHSRDLEHRGAALLAPAGYRGRLLDRNHERSHWLFSPGRPRSASSDDPEIRAR